MSTKGMEKCFNNLRKNFNIAKKFASVMVAGSRIIPSRSSKNDQDYELRIDAGELIGTRLNVYLQVNANPKSTFLKNWLRKHSTHENLASAVYDTAVDDKEAEAARVMDELQTKGTQRLKE